MRSKAAVVKAVVPEKVPESNEKTTITVAENKTKVSNWMIALGVGAVVAVGTAFVVYQVKRNRQKEKEAIAMYSPYSNPTVEDYENVFSRYWGLGQKTFSSVRSVITGFFKSEEKLSPFHDSETVSPFGLSSVDTEDEVIL
tara:strand:+ start:94861 stop:95283 length:423 start_codon:yes stop_codon:yes gene_type:complete